VSDGTKPERGDRVTKLGHVDEDDEDEFDKQSVTTNATTTASSSNRSTYINCLIENIFSIEFTPACSEKIRDLRLDQYLSINTSEDNVSFEHIMDETQKKERTKVHQAWLYGQQALTHSVRKYIQTRSDVAFIGMQLEKNINRFEHEYRPSME
jgi:hypothetical protein